MDKQRRSRQRGVVLTAQGQQKLQVARRAAERAENGGDRYTLEELSELTGVSLKTVTKVLDARTTVDRPTLEAFFHAFGLLLDRQDYRYPGVDATPQNDSPVEPAAAITGPPSAARPLVDWGEAPDVSLFFGRQEELQQLKQWVLPEHGQPRRLIAILGMGGMGKTTLATKLLHEVIQEPLSRSAAFSTENRSFDYVIWRSLRNAPSYELILSQWLSILSNYQETQTSVQNLLHYLQKYRCLLVLDNLETILSSVSGCYRQGYERYGELLNLMGETVHRSTLIVTSRERTTEFNTLAGEQLPVCCLNLKGSHEASRRLVQIKQLRGTAEQQQQLCDRYGNSPLAIKIITATIQDLFDGDIQAFLQEETMILPGIRRLLDQQFDRLPELEQTILFWLAINRDWTAIEDLSADILPGVARSKILAAIEGLHWRNLIEKKQRLYTQQPMVMEYLTERLIEGISAEILALQQQPPSLLHRFAILKTTVKDYIRDSQQCLIVAAIARELQASLGSEMAIAQHLKASLATLRPTPTDFTFTPEPSYAAGNLLNLLCFLNVDLTGCDCSGLAVWHAYLPNVPLPHTNFTHADLRRSQLTDTFGAIFCLAFSPDGTCFATGELSGHLRLWRISDGNPIWTVKACQSWIRSVAFSPNGALIAIGAGDYTVELLQVSTGEWVRSLRGHRDQVHGVAFHPSGKLLASACGDHTVRLWEVDTGNCVHLFAGDAANEGHTDQVQSVCFSPDGKWLVSGSSDRTIKLWQVETRELRQTLVGHGDQVFCVAIHPSGALLASGSADGTIYLWQMQSGEPLQTLSGHTAHVLSVQFSPDGSQLASSGSDRTIRLWDTATGQLVNQLCGHTNWVRAVQFSPDGHRLLSGGNDYTIKLWTIPTGQTLKTWLGYSNWIWSVDFNDDGTRIVSSGGDRAVRIWDATTGQCLKTMRGHTNWVLAIACNRESSLVASGGSDNSVILWDVRHGRVLKTLVGHSMQVLYVQFSPTENVLASSSSDYSIRLWRIPDGKPLRVLQGHQDWIRSISFRNDGRVLASAGQDAVVKLWDVQTGDCLHTLQNFETWVWGVSFHPDGDRLLTASGHTLQLWQANTGCLLRTYHNPTQDQTSWIRSIAFSPDGQRFASGGQNHLVQIWDCETGAALQTFSGHTDQILSVKFSPNGRTLISSSADETVKIWDMATGRLRQTLQSERMYEGMAIAGITGLSEETISTLYRLGATGDQDT